MILKNPITGSELSETEINEAISVLLVLCKWNPESKQATNLILQLEELEEAVSLNQFKQ